MDTRYVLLLLLYISHLHTSREITYPTKFGIQNGNPFLALAADIDIKGKIHNHKNNNILHLECSSTIPTLGCTVEFLINGISVDDLRSVNNICYHTNYMCSFDICACSNKCEKFVLNITANDIIDFENSTFGCETKMKVAEQIHLASISLTLDGNQKKTISSLETQIFEISKLILRNDKEIYFRVFEKIVLPVPGMTLTPESPTDQTLSITYSATKERKTYQGSTRPKHVVVIVCSISSVAFLLILLAVVMKNECQKFRNNQQSTRNLTEVKNDGNQMHVAQRIIQNSDVFMTGVDIGCNGMQEHHITGEIAHEKNDSYDSNKSDEAKILIALDSGVKGGMCLQNSVPRARKSETYTQEANEKGAKKEHKITLDMSNTTYV